MIFLSLPLFKVTGGANGLGRAICIELAKCGCHVAVADIDHSGADKTAQDLKRLGVKARAYRVNITLSTKIGALKMLIIRIFRSTYLNMKKCITFGQKSKGILARLTS